MGKKKQATTDSNYTNENSGSFDTTTQNELGFAIKPQTQSFKDLQAWRPQADSSIPFRFGAQRQRAMSSYNNLGGAYGSPELTAARMRGTDEEIGQNEGQAYSDDTFRQNQQRLGQLSTLAGLEDPVAFNKSTRSTGQNFARGSGASHGMQTQPGQGLFGSILSGIGGAIPFI